MLYRDTIYIMKVAQIFYFFSRVRYLSTPSPPNDAKVIFMLCCRNKNMYDHDRETIDARHPTFSKTDKNFQENTSCWGTTLKMEVAVHEPTDPLFQAQVC